MRDETRQCGNCGKDVSKADITCPHCGALLAAYEAPADAISGTESAVTPVAPTVDNAITPRLDSRPGPGNATTSPSRPYESPTSKSLSDIEHDSLRIDEPDTPRNGRPVTNALTQTHRADDDHHEPPAPSDQPVSLAEAREILGLNPKPAEDTVPVGSDTPGAASRPKQRSRPTPAQRGRYASEPVAQQTNRQPSREQQEEGQPGFNIWTFVGIIAIIVIAFFVFRSGTLPGLLIIALVIGGLLWFMSTVAKNTGRKSTSMSHRRDRR